MQPTVPLWKSRPQVLATLRAEGAAKGHTCVLRQELIGSFHDIDRSSATTAIASLEDDGSLKKLRVDGKVWTYEPDLYDDERDVARLLKMPDEQMPALNLSKYVGLAILREPCDFTHEQSQAARAVVGLDDRSSRAVVVTGGPGTGKTTVLRAACAAAAMAGMRVRACAPTGAAAERVTRALGPVAESSLVGGRATTVHQMLGPRRRKVTIVDGVAGARGRRDQSPDQEYIFKYGAHERVPDVDLCVVDEASLMDVRLFASLLRALPDRARIAIVGDPDQMPPVGPGSVFADVVASSALPTVRLDAIHRGAEGSAIAELARRAMQPGIDAWDLRVGDGDDAQIVWHDDCVEDRDLVAKTLEICERERASLPADATMVVICPRRKTVDELNRELQDALNPVRGRHRAGDDDIGRDAGDAKLAAPAGDAKLRAPALAKLRAPGDAKLATQAGDAKLRTPALAKLATQAGDAKLAARAGDRVVYCRNDATLGRVNGDTGTVASRLPKGALKIEYDDGSVCTHDPSDSETNVELAYASTPNRAHANKYDVVVLALSPGHTNSLQRTMLYTAITRARKRVHVVATLPVLQACLSNAHREDRASNLRWWLSRDPDQLRDERGFASATMSERSFASASARSFASSARS
jgi:exodeoxyribonuclease V alpha subunit